MKHFKALLNQKSVLSVLGCVALVLAFVCSGEPVVSMLQCTFLEKLLLNLGWQNAIVFNLAIGYLVSLMFWYLVVHLPEMRRKQVLKANLSLRYKWFKEETIKIFASAGGERFNSGQEANLQNYKGFRAFYRADGEAKWNAVLNGLLGNIDGCMSNFILELDFFAGEIDYSLSNLSVNRVEDHYVFRQFKESAYRFKNTHYDHSVSQKPISNFVWSVFGAWDSDNGQRDYDFMQDAIDRL